MYVHIRIAEVNIDTNLAMGWTTKGAWFHCRQETFLFFVAVKPVLGSTQPLLEGVPVAVFSGQSGQGMKLVQKLIKTYVAITLARTSS